MTMSERYFRILAIVREMQDDAFIHRHVYDYLDQIEAIAGDDMPRTVRPDLARRMWVGQGPPNPDFEEEAMGT